MTSDQHRVTLSPRPARTTHPAPASPGPGAPARRLPSTGAATNRRTLSPSFAAPVLIHSNADPAGEKDSQPDAHSVLFIHGQPGSSLVWMRVLPLLRDHGVRTFSVLRRDDSQIDGEAIDQFANAAALGRLLDEEQRPPAVIVGHGAGAGLALALAATAPRHVHALVLVAPASGPQTISATDRVLAAPVLGPSLSWLGFQAAGLALRFGPLRDLIVSRLVRPSTPDTKSVAARLTDGRTWRTFAAKQRRLVTYARCLHQGLTQLSCPIFIVAGRQDQVAPARVVQALSRRLPGSQTITTNTGHLVPIDDPDVVAAAILSALRIDYRDSRAAIGANGYLV